jgi:cell filamentation protein
MSSKYRLDNSPIYIEGTDIPKNRLDIEDPQTLHSLESDLLVEAYTIFLEELTSETIFDETYFKSLHRRTFESLYEWAGRYRTFNMSKGGSRFCQGAYVEKESKRIFEELAARNWLKDCGTCPKEEFAQKLAYFKCELIALHPFYELNGRITRLFIDMIAAYNGYYFIDYRCSAEEYIDASIDCVQFADCKKMQKIISDGLKRDKDHLL